MTPPPSRLHQQREAGVAAAMITHFTHPGHHLAEVTLTDVFTCGACKTPGTGPRYRCTEPGCQFILHSVCATCPDRVRFFIHPDHDLVRRGRPKLLIRVCDVCCKEVRGIFYTCCGVHVHPPCTRVPPTLTAAPAHPGHALSFVRSRSGRCDSCGRKCESWRYRCEPCGIDLHVTCLRGPPVTAHHGDDRLHLSELLAKGKKLVPDSEDVGDAAVEIWLKRLAKSKRDDNWDGSRSSEGTNWARMIDGRGNVQFDIPPFTALHGDDRLHLTELLAKGKNLAADVEGIRDAEVVRWLKRRAKGKLDDIWDDGYSSEGGNWARMISGGGNIQFDNGGDGGNRNFNFLSGGGGSGSGGGDSDVLGSIFDFILGIFD